VLSAVKAAGLNERVNVRETVDDLPAFLASCDIIAVPTLRDTTGRLALEAAAVGRPVIASRLDALTAIIEDGHTGLLTPPNHPQALADALALLLASPALRIQMGRQARVRCEEHLTLAPTVTALETLLHHAQKTPRWLTPPEWRL
jgi:glycosyltransferase involved in cell wall biosynthesis